jgi:U6 snRNA-associated Sm-like protein LSm2
VGLRQNKRKAEGRLLDVFSWLCSSPRPPYKHSLTPLSILLQTQIFYSFFKTLVGKEVAVELKNDVVLTGTLHSVDQYLNVKLLNVKVVNPDQYPQLCSLQNTFVRGSVVRYIQIPSEHVDTELLQEACRKENATGAAAKK